MTAQGQRWDAPFIEVMLCVAQGGSTKARWRWGGAETPRGSSTTVGWQQRVPQTLPGSSFSVTVRLNTSWGEAEGQH